ncbi:MAG: hypothetical protein ABI811_24050 [Acidobacteriota bacterium]
MSCYISSNNNRAYVALESTYGNAAEITEANRIPLLKLETRQVAEQSGRRDKTGSRTFAGLPNRLRTNTTFRLNTFMTQWGNAPAAPSHGPLFQAAMGGTPLTFNGGTVASVPTQTQVVFSGAHGLSIGQAVTFGGEMRFVAGIPNSTTVVINAAFTESLVSGSAIGATVTYPLATDPVSATIFDYWDPVEAVQRILNGAAVDVMKVKVNGDFQEFEFSGVARDLIDSASFTSGQAGLSAFPAEPARVGFDYTIVPGHLGQVWMGSAPSRMHALTSAEMSVGNNLALRTKEFGSDLARCISAGQRTVKLNFSVFEQDDAESAELYQAARQRSPIEVMLQLGEQQGQMFGAYMPAVIPDVPRFDDGDTRLEWVFENSRAQGAVDDELFIAFG